ncbi:MAG TPA: ABC transporter substrate-binding protein [Dehalococcoidia bacterium]|nr:ABC transporter substrate-binding protein [Dehalococcoidia bacterium]
MLAFAAAALVSSCGGGGSNADTVKVQLDWTPNTNHIGIYIALAKGWYKDAGLKVEVLPYTDVNNNPDQIVANGKADVGVSFPPNLIFSRAAGLDLVSIAAVLQRHMAELAVLDSSSIQRPRDLDGKLYAGFGLPYEAPQIQTVIRADGGKGDFETATLSTAAYEALYNKRADFTEIFTAWEGIEASLRGIKLRTFRYDQYGVPDYPGVVLVARGDAVAGRQAKLVKFIEVTRRGYEYAAEHPDEAAKLFIDYLPKGTFPEEEMVKLSTEMLAPVFVASDRHWGFQGAAKWDAYTQWLLKSGTVTDGSDRVLQTLPGGPLFTNDLLPK